MHLCKAIAKNLVKPGLNTGVQHFVIARIKNNARGVAMLKQDFLRIVKHGGALFESLVVALVVILWGDAQTEPLYFAGWGFGQAVGEHH